MASRIEARLMPSCSLSRRSEGRRSPGFQMPRTIRLSSVSPARVESRPRPDRGRGRISLKPSSAVPSPGERFAITGLTSPGARPIIGWNHGVVNALTGFEKAAIVSPGLMRESGQATARRPSTPMSTAELTRLGALRETAREVRRLVVDAIYHAQAGHLGGPLSAADILVALYFDLLRIDPERPSWPERDRFILSKGHSSIGLYAVLAKRGYFPVEELRTFDAIDSRLQG